MRYDVAEIPEEEFRHYMELVTRAMTSRRSKRSTRELNIGLVTNDYKQFDPTVSDAKIRKQTLVGQAWLNRIWIKSGRGIGETRITAIHEISHLGEKSCAHGAKWRKIFGMSLAFHMREQGKTENQIIEAIGELAVYRYRKYRRYTPQGDINPWREYRRKCDTEVDDIYRASTRGTKFEWQ